MLPSPPGHLSDYILGSQGEVPAEQCKDLIDCFESVSLIHRREVTPGYAFTSLDLATPAGAELYTSLQGVFSGVADRYYSGLGLSAWRPKHAGFERIRVKRYLPGGVDVFRPHVDQADYASARRYLALLLYLNDVEVGGETLFPWGIAVTPRAGTILAFPPGLPYVHSGEPPISGPKYIAMTYAHLA